MRLLLASASPRRVDLLVAAGFACDVEAADVDEMLRDGETPAAYVRRLAGGKAALVGCRNPGRVVIAADTTVVVEGRLFGKPADAREAAGMLQALSGRTHEVLTGVAVRRDAAHADTVEVTAVRFLPLSAADVAWYVASGEPAGKAGGYAIQGLASRFIERIDGSYTSVVGLPVATVCRLLRQIGVNPLDLEGSHPGASRSDRRGPGPRGSG
jgi:septum formation protein